MNNAVVSHFAKWTEAEGGQCKVEFNECRCDSLSPSAACCKAAEL